MIENDFSKGNVCRHILMQAVPLTIAQLIQLLYNVVDRIYIGHLPGTQGEALTGVSDYFHDCCIYQFVFYGRCAAFFYCKR